MVEILSQIVEFRNGESGLHVLHIKVLTEMLLEEILKKTGQIPPDTGAVSDDLDCICASRYRKDWD